MYIFFFFNDTATTEIYTLSLHDALPISSCNVGATCEGGSGGAGSMRQETARSGRAFPPGALAYSSWSILMGWFKVRPRRARETAVLAWIWPRASAETTRPRAASISGAHRP